MNRKIQHTPEGVRDIINDECSRKLKVEEKIHQVFTSFGYRDIETPTFEFFDVFGARIGTTPSNELYKFFDRDGNTLVLRPDFTPSIARAASRFYADSTEPIRLCYRGSTFINHSNYMGRLKENTQMGVELIGDGSASADAEIAAMAIRTLLAAGLDQFQITLGNVDLFRALTKEAGLDEADEAELLELIRNKNSFGAWKFLEKMNVPSEIAAILEKLPTLTGGEEVLVKARELFKPLPDTAAVSEAYDALERLERVTMLLKAYGLSKYILIDLSLTSRFMYYTGVIFRGYTYGSGEAIIKGGRYNGLLSQFGMDAPAVGFVSEISQIMNVILRSDKKAYASGGPVLVLGNDSDAETAIKEVSALREAGTSAVLKLLEENAADEDDAYYKRQGYSKVIRPGKKEGQS